MRRGRAVSNSGDEPPGDERTHRRAARAQIKDRAGDVKAVGVLQDDLLEFPGRVEVGLGENRELAFLALDTAGGNLDVGVDALP